MDSSHLWRARWSAALLTMLLAWFAAPALAVAYGPNDPEVPYVEPLPFYCCQGAFTRDLSTAPLDPNSAAYVNDLGGLVHLYGAFVDGGSGPIFDTTSSTPPTPVYLDHRQVPGYSNFASGIPLPANATPNSGTDGVLSVYNPSTTELWTMWRVSTPQQNAVGCTQPLPWGQPCWADGHWHAVGGAIAGSIRFSPGYFDYQSLPGATTTNSGTSATSNINPARQVLASEVLNGHIGHAVAVASAVTGNCETTNSWPAQRNDGSSTAPPPGCIPEGTFFRLDPTLNLCDEQHDTCGPGTTKLPTFTYLVAQAAQRYGLCVCESTQGGPTLQTENTTQYGYNAWTSQYLLFGQTKSSVLRSFPWASLQAVAAPTRYDTGLTQVASTTTATPATTAAAAGQPVSVAVTVTASDGRTVPGAVYVSGSNGTQLQSALLGSATGGGAGTVSVTPPAPGTYTYTISYGGDQTVKPSSASVTVTAS